MGDSFLSWHAQQARRMIVSPQELPPFQTRRWYLQSYIDLLRTDVTLVPLKLIFNLDEIDLSDWEERKRKSVLVRAESGNQELHSPVDCAIRHQTLLCYVSPSGDAYCPFGVSVNGSVLDILNRWVQEHVNLQIQIVDSSEMTSEISINYLRNVLIPAMEGNRSLPGWSEKLVILFCDNCSCRCNEDIMKKLDYT
jgi:hypothetical protein